MNVLAKSRELTVARQERRNELRLPGPILKQFLQPLADYLAGKYPEKPSPAPNDLGEVLAKLDPETLALIILEPLLRAIFGGWNGKDSDSAEMLLCMQVGKYLRERLIVQNLITADSAEGKAKAKNFAMILKKGPKYRKHLWRYLHSDWCNRQTVTAGIWLIEQAMATDLFDLDKRRLPIIGPRFKPVIDQLTEEILRRDPYYLPQTDPIPDWTGWRAEYGNGVGMDFVRDWHPQTKEAITAAFVRGEFQHADGVNALQSVELIIDPVMLSLVEEFAVKIMDHEGERREADERLVKADVRDAKYVLGQPVRLNYSCDYRGRVYPGPNLNFGRQDHVRALFKFANGMRLGYRDIEWLEVHCANCEGSTDKDPWSERHKWVDEHRRDILKIADDPHGTFHLWKDADKPFAYVAACIELAAAWREPDTFITTLPISFDGTANGLQHLAMLKRDAEAGKLVNLIDSDRPQDVYGEIVSWVRYELKVDDTDPLATWWDDQFRRISDKLIRKLIKTPSMTYAYNVTRSGMIRQLCDVYFDKIKRQSNDATIPPEGAWGYLADKIREACIETLRGPTEVMEYIGKLVEHCTKNGRFLEWTSPTGFPVCNRYNVENIERVYFLRNGVKAEYRVGEGCLDEIDGPGALLGGSPNYVHSLDGSHLVRTINAARAEGITNILTVHDSFSCLAPQARRFNQILRRELAIMYLCYGGLASLRSANADNDFPEPPAYGDLDPLDVQDSEWPFN